jgi:hypothetical protein
MGGALVAVLRCCTELVSQASHSQLGNVTQAEGFAYMLA